MGLDANGVRFLAQAAADKVNFERSVMLGRQSLHVSASDLKSMLSRGGISVSLKDAERIIDNPVGIDFGYAETFLQVLGAQSISSFDNSGYEKATHVVDLNNNLPLELFGQYTCVIDGGTLEHVFDFPNAIRNCMKLLKPNGHFLILTPCNNFMGHGFYQFSPELFYRLFSDANGFCVEKMYIYEHGKRATWYSVEDPRSLGRRVELVNGQPTYLLIQAKRTATGDLEQLTAKQSDYSTIWSTHESDSGSINVANVGIGSRLASTFRRIAPQWVRDLYHYHQHRLHLPGGTFRRPFYQKYNQG